MGSLVVKIDTQTNARLKNIRHYSDIDMFTLHRDRGQSDDLPMVYDVEAVKQSLRNILMWRVGENILRPDFGHDIHRSMYQQIDNMSIDSLAQQVQRAIEQNEPRVDLKEVSVFKDDEDENLLRVRVVYKVKGNKTDDVSFVEQTTISGK